MSRYHFMFTVSSLPRVYRIRTHGHSSAAVGRSKLIIIKFMSWFVFFFLTRVVNRFQADKHRTHSKPRRARGHDVPWRGLKQNRRPVSLDRINILFSDHILMNIHSPRAAVAVLNRNICR